MKQETVDIIFGSLLHDIGKVVQRESQEKVKHAKIGGDFVAQYIDNDNVLEQIYYHHAPELRRANLADNNLAYITYIADNVASGADRRSEQVGKDSSYTQFDSYLNLQDIFNTLEHISSQANQESKRYYKAQMFDDRTDINYPSADNVKFTQGDYAAIVTKFKETLPLLETKPGYVNSLVDLTESTLSYVPSSTNLEEVSDISLFDHLKVTAAVATCILHYCQEKKISNFREFLFDKSQNFYKEDAFQLMSFDISGIQDFIYQIRPKNAAKMLRSRSFYLEILAENLIDTILKRLDLSRANLLYSGGGHAYLLLANTEKTNQALADVEAEINMFLREKFQNNLYIAFGKTICSANVLKGDDDQRSYGKLYQEVSESISSKKLNRYSAQDIKNLNQQGKIEGRECPICHTIHQKGTDEDGKNQICDFCQGLIAFSRPLQNTDFFEINQEESLLPLGFGDYLHTTSLKSIQNGEVKGRIYSKNKFHTSSNQITHLWVGDYDDGHTFEDYSGASGKLETKGINRLGVLRCDVDDLGQAFISGFPENYNTISRSATFSRSMSIFFKFHINQILENLESKATIIYAGGDDVFLVGAWYDILEFAIEFREAFLTFTQGKLTMSSGVGLFPNKTPVPILADATGELEEEAKDQEDSEGNIIKDAISLFSDEYVFSWDEFIEKVWKGKLPLLYNFFESSSLSSDYGKAFAYKLLDLISEKQVEVNQIETEDKTISSARWVYFLSRMEPKKAAEKEEFKRFAQELNTYFEDSQSRKELELALQLYLLMTRSDD